MATHAFGGDGANGCPLLGEEEWYRALVERVPAVLYVDASDEGSSAVYMSPRSEALLGYSLGEWLEDPQLWVKILHPGDRGRVLSKHLRARRDGSPFEAEYRLIARDGSVVWVHDEAAPVASGDEEPGRRVGVLMDVTDRKRYEKELRKSEERHRLVARATGEAIWDNDLLTGIQEWDGATEALFGYPPRESRTGRWWEERVHPDDRGRLLSSLETLLGGGESVWSKEYRFRRADGSFAEVEDRGYVVRDGAGRPVRMVGSMKDVTERRRHEEELKESEERFRTAFEAAAVGMAHVAPDGRWLRVNGRLCEIAGRPREELLGATLAGVVHPDDEGIVRDLLVRTASGRNGPCFAEVRLVRGDGSRLWVRLSFSLARKLSGRQDHLVLVAEDVTARKLGELLAAPLTSRETEVLRRLAAGQKNARIAAELSYALGTVKLDVRRLLAKLCAGDRRRAASRAVEMGLIPPPR